MTAASYFITGTDTGVGKTALTASLALAYQQAGLRGAPLKPVQTGCDVTEAGGLRAPDLDFVLSLLDTPELPGMCPYRYQPACSPHLAAEQSKRPICLETIQTCYEKLASQHDGVFVEGAGGVLVPLDRTATMLDLMSLLNLPVLLAARSGLGTLNHTLLSIRALREAGLDLKGVVLVDCCEVAWTDIEHDNRRTIEQIADTPVLGHIPFHRNLDTSPTAKQHLMSSGTAILEHLITLPS